ncbi:hypothetical protein HYY27_05925 [bacterium]|nr:hypothetical protein [bacterium]
MSILITPQERRTSEIPYHSDLAPGRRFVFVGRPVYPHSRFYIVGRRVERVPKDQPEWLEDHRHNCNTFYLFVGDREDLSGLRAVVTVEGQTFEARAPAAVLLPEYALHHYRLIEGSGWSFHVNLRGDYEESLAAPGDADAAEVPTPAVEDVYKLARRQGGGRPGRWSFIDDRFARPGIRLTVCQVAGAIRGQIESHRFEEDGASLIIAAPGATLRAEVVSDGERVEGASPATIYHPGGTFLAYERVEGAGFIVDAELEKA